PMPGLVTDPVAVSPREAQLETKFARAAAQPAKRGGVTEFFVESNVVGRTDVEGPARVVLAETGRGHEFEDRCEALAGREFLADECGLPRHAAKAGEGQQHNAVIRRGRTHAPPRRGGGRREPDQLAVVGRGADGDERASFALGPESATARVAGRDAE